MLSPFVKKFIENFCPIIIKVRVKTTNAIPCAQNKNCKLLTHDLKGI